jgi:serine/threonine protein kinase
MSSAPTDPEKPAPAAIMAEQEALAPGTRFGELEIVRVLGVGGFGIVYLARDHSLERDVALKEYMPAALAVRGQGPQVTVRSGALSETYAVGLRSFVNEARLLAKFDHPSLVKVYRFWEDNATAYMVMPYLQGRTLREARRAMAEAPDEAWIRGVIDPLLGALEVLHREGVFHRDIAPDNVLLPREGPPVLLDFGAARRVISDRTQSLTAILKPNYAPIEQYAEMTSLRQGPWTDLYALGAVVHFLLQGTPPAPATARAVQDEMAPLWMRNFPGVSQRFLAAIDWALAVRPQERPQSVDALRAVFDGRAEAPTFARTVPGSTSLLPVSGASVKTGYEPTQVAPTRPEPTFAPTVPAPAPPRAATSPATAPRAATPPMPAAAAPRPARTRAVAAAPGAPSRKGLVGAALAVAAVLAAAAGWQVLGTRDADAPAAAGASPAPASPVAPVARPAPAPTPAVAAGASGAPAGDPTAASVPVGPAAKEPPLAALPGPSASPRVPPAPAGERVVPIAGTRHAGLAPGAGDNRTGGPAPVEPPSAEREADKIPNAGPAESPRADRSRTLRQAIRANRLHQEAARAADVPLGAAPAGATPLGAALPGDAPLGAVPTGPATARQACGGRVLVALWTCMQRECRKPRYAQQADCIKVNEDRRARELQ